MTRVRTFRALRYDTARVELSRVIVPPYDVIAGDERASFYARDPHNAIRFELTRDVADEASTDYAQVGRSLAEWRSSGVLRQDERPGFYVMEQRFRAPDGRSLARIGFFGELGLEDYANGVVRPHERTLAGPKADRLKVLRAARANLSAVFFLYEDRSGDIESLLRGALSDAPLATARDESGIEYRLASLPEGEAARRIGDFLRDRPVVIADGHHRYETALAYRDEQRRAAGLAGANPSAPYEATLGYFANAYAEGSLLLPIHRVVRKVAVPTDAAWRDRLPGWEEKRVALPDVDSIEALLARELAPLADRSAFAADDGGGQLRVFSRRGPASDLVVRIVETEVLGGVLGLSAEAIREGAVSFPKSAERAAREVRSGEGTVALYLNPLSPDDVFRATEAGEVMPQKSTFFYPKVPTGMVFREHGAARGDA